MAEDQLGRGEGDLGRRQEGEQRDGAGAHGEWRAARSGAAWSRGRGYGGLLLLSRGSRGPSRIWTCPWGISGLGRNGGTRGPQENAVGVGRREWGLLRVARVLRKGPRRVPRAGRGAAGVGGDTHLSAGQGTPGHGERAIQLGRVIVLQRRVQLVPGGPRAGGCGRGARGRGRGRRGWSSFRVGGRGSGVWGGRRLLFLLQLPESAEGHGSGAPRRRRSLRAAGQAATRGCQPGGWCVAFLYRLGDRGGRGAASRGLAPRTADSAPPPGRGGPAVPEPRPQLPRLARLGKLLGTGVLNRGKS